MDAVFSAHAALLFASALALFGIMTSLAASRFGVPLLLVFLGVGILAGEDGIGRVAFNDYKATYLVGSAAIAIILFDGGLRTRLSAVRSILLPAGILASLGVVVTAGLTAAIAWLVLPLRPVEAMLVGAILASTDAAVVFFLLRTGGLQLRKRLGATLEVESGTNDPFAVLLTVLLVEIALGETQFDTLHVIVAIVREGSIGLAIGMAGGLALVSVLNRLDLPSGLHPVFVVTAALVIFALTQLLGASGFLAAYVAGLVVGNRPVRAYGTITAFHDAATWMCQIALFTLLGLLVTPSKIIPVLLPGIAIALVLILVARPIAVFACMAPFGFTRREMTFLSWVGLRGGVSIFLATIPLLAGSERGELFFNIAFIAVVVSLVVQGWTIAPAARKLGVALREHLPEIQRIDIDLPGQLDAELVGYPMLANSPAARHRALPRWVRPILVIREGAILEPAAAGPLQPKDYAYFLAPTARLNRLDRFFAVDGKAPDPTNLSEFPFDGSTRIGTIADLYNLDVDPSERGYTVAQLFDARLDGAPQENDVVELGSASLVAHHVTDETVRLAGLLLDAPTEEEEAAEDAARRARLWRRIADRTRERWGKKA